MEDFDAGTPIGPIEAIEIELSKQVKEIVDQLAREEDAQIVLSISKKSGKTV